MESVTNMRSQHIAKTGRYSELKYTDQCMAASDGWFKPQIGMPMPQALQRGYLLQAYHCHTLIPTNGPVGC